LTDEATTVFAVDDDPSVRQAMERLLRSAGFRVEVFSTAAAFLDRYHPDVTGCVILDLAMPGLDGLQLQQELIRRGGVLPILFLSGHGDIPRSVQAMKQGAVDFLIKPVDDEELLAAVQHALKQCESLVAARRDAADFKRRVATLTPREREVLAKLLTGGLNKQIAASLGTSEKTVKFHRAHILQKMGVPVVAVLVARAARAGHRAELSQT
jgi:FixJ family two-component response regulator